MSPHPRRRTRLAGLLAATLAAVSVGIAAPSAAALTADQATTSFERFVDVFWDPDARYFFTYSDHRVHPEHVHGPQGGLYTDYCPRRWMTALTTLSLTVWAWLLAQGVPKLADLVISRLS